MARRAFGSFSIIALLICAALLGGAASASAAIVTNGDFESGTLEGWTTTDQNAGAASWATYSRKEIEEHPIFFAPPSGQYAAYGFAPGGFYDTIYLYQDVALPPATADQLSMHLYYRSGAPFAVPTPDTLVVSEAKGAQA